MAHSRVFWLVLIMKKFLRILALGFLGFTLSSCDLITYWDCKRENAHHGADYAARVCKSGNN